MHDPQTMILTARTDNNHADIRDGLQKAGYLVQDTSNVGNGFPGLMVQSKAINPIFVLLEIKSLEYALLVMERYDKVRFD